MKELLLDLKRRGLAFAPKVAVGDGALGFWKALRQVFSATRVQRCSFDLEALDRWVHKTANILNKLPKSVQKRAKQRLQDIWIAPATKAEAGKACTYFLDAYGRIFDGLPLTDFYDRLGNMQEQPFNFKPPVRLVPHPYHRKQATCFSELLL